MKSKLRKEFEAFKLKTQQQIWELQHPPKFKFGDALVTLNEGRQEVSEAICKSSGEVSEATISYFSSYSGDPIFVRKYIIEINDTLTSWLECYLKKVK